MSNIPPPNSYDNSNLGSPYPYGDLSATGADLSSNYGMDGYGDPYGTGQNSALQQYAYDRQLALQTLQSGNLDPQTRQAWEYYLNVTLPDWFNKYGSAAESLGGISGSDLSNGMGTSLNGSAINKLQLGEMIWQDQTRAKWDGADLVTYTLNQQSDTRQQDFFQNDVTLKIPYHGSVAQTQLVSDDSVPGSKMLQVTVSMPDGSSRVVNVHHVTEQSNIQILATDPANVKPDVSLTTDPLASQVTISDINSATASTQPQGDLPTKRIDGKLGWDGGSFSIYSTEDGRDKSITATGTVAFYPLSQTEFWTVDWDNTKHQYVIHIYNEDPHTNPSAKSKETFFMDDMTNLQASFDIDPIHIYFDGELGDSNDPHQLNTSNAHAQKLSFGTEDSSGDNTPLPKDATPYDKKVGNTTAVWKTWKDVNVYTKDGFQVHEITAPGTVTIHGDSYSDTMKVASYDANAHFWVIQVYKDGDPNQFQTFHIKGGANTKVVLDAMDAGSVTYENGASSDCVEISSDDAGGNDSSVNTSSDTPPTDRKGDTWTYTPSDGKVDLNATFDHKDNQIKVTGDVTIHIADTQTASLVKDGANYLLTVKDKNGKPVTYHIDGNAQSLNVDGNELSVDLDKDCLFDNKIKVQGKTASETIAAKNYLSTVISFGAGAIQDDNLKFKNVNDKDFYQKVMALVEKSVQDIAAALKSNDWSMLDADFSNLNDLGRPMPGGGYEFLFRALRGVLNLEGTNAKNKLKAVFGQMPNQIRQKWVDGLKTVGSDNMKIKDSDISEGAWMEDPNQEPDWTIQNSVDLIKSMEPDQSSGNP